MLFIGTYVDNWPSVMAGYTVEQVMLTHFLKHQFLSL